MVQGNGEYNNSFTAIPAGAAKPPAGVVHPPTCEAQSAIVIKNDDPSFMGRVKVRMQWQKAPVMTDWIRIVQPHAGKNKGMYFIPELKEEVWVDFENGNPERPYVLGSMYHSEKGNRTNGNLRSHPTIKNGVKTNDIKLIQTRSGHTIELNDKKGKETITIKDKNKNTIVYDTVKKSNTITAPLDIALNSTRIKLTASESIDFKAPRITADGADLVNLKSPKEVKVESDKLVEVQGREILKLEGVKSAVLHGGSDGLNVQSSKEVHIKGPKVKVN